jgi:uncharacterized LabA/DUF88 family protein
VLGPFVVLASSLGLFFAFSVLEEEKARRSSRRTRNSAGRRSHGTIGAIMKICIFFDGQNFYRSLLRYDESVRVDYDRLAVWITQKVGGDTAVFGGAYYYVGVSAGAPQQVEAFLKGLELRPGYFVKRDPRVRRTGRCPNCGGEYEYTTEKRVDTRLVADLIHYAANGAYDAAVLVSGDDDFVPAVDAVNALGKQVWVATWSAEELSTDLRVRCFGQIRLSEGIAAFRVERPRVLDRDRERSAPPRGPRPPLRAAVRPLAEDTLDRALSEVQRAEARLPHVSRGYFVMRWKSHTLPPVGQEREALVQQLLDARLIEEFDVTDGEGRQVVAIRSRVRDGNVREPDGPSGNIALPG